MEREPKDKAPKWSQIVQKAAADEKFKKKLYESPILVLKEYASTL